MTANGEFWSSYTWLAARVGRAWHIRLSNVNMINSTKIYKQFLAIITTDEYNPAR